MHRRFSEAELQAEMSRLLEGIQVKWLRPKVGYSRQTIYDWKNGEGVTLDRLQQVSEIVGRPLRLDGHDEAAEPKWARRLTDEVLTEIRTRWSVDDLAEKFAQRLGLPGRPGSGRSA